MGKICQKEKVEDKNAIKLIINDWINLLQYL